ncbi:unnamed protein product (macronuclear) [Paramecium tetraurelia]|uniref:Uncharacterized protein n=1 Tax=Paramecium tetraurelia TaxID=5888 RepID=A0DFS4_PARTE|nr:uncharacterized protein GSPATT00016704001 [Paramecium tetraurelia]CAK81891.1 unnamed protein product [Paramecium tetraurelia]|eukprot:XP_001449288.1 hypothetical protein (macronuclear) [Paramecium tetraurelia strain d4-2]
MHKIMVDRYPLYNRYKEPLIFPKDKTMLEMVMLFQHERKSLFFHIRFREEIRKMNISNLIVEGQNKLQRQLD